MHQHRKFECEMEGVKISLPHHIHWSSRHFVRSTVCQLLINNKPRASTHATLPPSTSPVCRTVSSVAIIHRRRCLLASLHFTTSSRFRLDVLSSHYTAVQQQRRTRERTTERRNEGRKERRDEGRKEGRNEGTKERRNEGTNDNEHRSSIIDHRNKTTPQRNAKISFIPTYRYTESYLHYLYTCFPFSVYLHFQDTNVRDANAKRGDVGKALNS